MPAEHHDHLRTASSLQAQAGSFDQQFFVEKFAAPLDKGAMMATIAAER